MCCLKFPSPRLLVLLVGKSRWLIKVEDWWNDTDRETEELRERTVHMPLGTPQIPHVYSLIEPSPAR